MLNLIPFQPTQKPELTTLVVRVAESHSNGRELSGVRIVLCNANGTQLPSGWICSILNSGYLYLPSGVPSFLKSGPTGRLAIKHGDMLQDWHVEFDRAGLPEMKKD